MNWAAYGLETDEAGRREGHLLVCAEASGDEPRSPVMVNILLDRSGSMKGAPLAAAIEAVQQFVELAGERDYLGLLVFDGIAEQRVPLCAMDERGRALMIDALADLHCGRGTALHQALDLGAKQLQRLLVPGCRPKLLLLTDGEPSVGPDQEKDFDELGTRLARQGVSVHTLGLARHYVAEILNAVSLPSGNAFEHVDGPDGLSVAMGAVFARLFGEVASQATVRVVPSGFTSLGCRHAYTTRAESEALVVTLGDVSRGSSRRVLLSGGLAAGTWSAQLVGSSTERGQVRHQEIPLVRVEVASSEGRLIRALSCELDLVAAETAGWTFLSRKDLDRAEAQLDIAESNLVQLRLVAVPGIAVLRHQERLKDLRKAVESGEGDLPLLIRRAKSAKAGTNMSQVIPFNPNRKGGR